MKERRNKQIDDRMMNRQQDGKEEEEERREDRYHVGVYFLESVGAPVSKMSEAKSL